MAGVRLRTVDAFTDRPFMCDDYGSGEAVVAFGEDAAQAVGVVDVEMPVELPWSPADPQVRARRSIRSRKDELHVDLADVVGWVVVNPAPSPWGLSVWVERAAQ